MKTIAAIHADFERTFAGLPARLNADLRGETVLRRTVRQLRKTPGLASIHLMADAAQEAAARQAIEGLDVTLELHQAGSPPWARYVASGRKWSLDAWRGGLAGTTVYDEFTHPWLLDFLAKRESADAVVDVPAAAPLLDPALLGQLIDYFEKIRKDVRLGLVQSAPGLSAVIYQPGFLAHLAGNSQPPGRAMAYLPESPQNDAIHQPCWFAADATIAHAWGRCIADTSTAMTRVDRIIADLGLTDPGRTPDALAVSRWLLANRNTRFDALPAEVEIEITTDDPLAASTLRPRGPALQRSARMEFAVFQRIVDELAGCDDRLIVLGGFGDPLLHPQWPDFIRHARSRGILGVALRTTGVSLDAQAIEELTACEPDVINVLIDGASAGAYRTLHQADHYDQICANIEALCNVQQQRQLPRPLIACEMLKTPETMDEIEPFYDRWIARTASAVIAGPSHYAGTWPDRAVVRMAPPTRFACARLPHRAMVLADGRMTLCDQDYRGAHAIGSLQECGLAELWNGSALRNVREKHLTGNWDALLPCRDCDEWHRP